MVDIFPVAQSILTLFLLIAIGIAVYRFGIIDAGGITSLSSFIVNVSLPALIVVSMQLPLSDTMIQNVFNLYSVAIVYYAISFAIAFVLPRVLTDSPVERGVLGFMLVFSNLGFMGFPIVQVLFGEEALFYVSLFNLPFGLLAFSIGILMLRPDLGRRPDLKLIANPGIFASILGLILFLGGFEIPSPFIDVARLLGSVTTPLAMVVVGCLLATITPFGMIRDYRLYILSLFRLIAIPLILWSVLKIFIQDPLLLGVPVILSAMPAAATTVLLAGEYRVDAALASEGVFATTLLSIFTIPIIATLVI